MDASNANDIKDGKEKSITEIFCMRAEEETLFLHSPFLNLNLIQPNFYLVSSIFIYYNGSNEKPTGKSLKIRIN